MSFVLRLTRSAAALAASIGLACSDPSPSPPAGDAGRAGSGAVPTIAGASGAAAGETAAGTGASSSGGTTGGGAGGGGGELTAFTGGAGAVNGGASGAFGSAGSSGGAAGGSGVARGKATMVVRGSGMPTAGDTLMIERLEAFGYREVVTVADAEANAAGVAGSDLVIISSSAESGPLRDRLKEIPIPVLCIEDAEFKLMGMATAGDHDAGVSQIVVKEGGSALLGSLSGSVTIASKEGELGWGRPAESAIVGATMPGDPQRAVVFGYPAGAQMATMVAPARRAGFAIREQLAANLNADGIAVFDAVLAWVSQD